jgi:hypothetical protein
VYDKMPVRGAELALTRISGALPNAVVAAPNSAKANRSTSAMANASASSADLAVKVAEKVVAVNGLNSPLCGVISAVEDNPSSTGRGADVAIFMFSYVYLLQSFCAQFNQRLTTVVFVLQ